MKNGLIIIILKSKKQKIILALSLIGYDTREVYKNDKLYNKLIRAYRIRYLNHEDKIKINPYIIL